MDITRAAALAAELRELADADRATFGLYREAHEEDVVARATTDGVVLFAAELLSGLERVDNPVGNSIIALDDGVAYRDAHADLNLYAVELHGDDLAPPRKRRLRITRFEYAAALGCLIALVFTSVLAVAGAVWIGGWAWRALT